MPIGVLSSLGHQYNCGCLYKTFTVRYFDKGYSLTIHIISVGFILTLRWTPAVSWVGYINTIKDFTGTGNWHMSDKIMTLHTAHNGWWQLHQSQGLKKKSPPIYMLSVYVKMITQLVRVCSTKCLRYSTCSYVTLRTKHMWYQVVLWYFPHIFITQLNEI